MVYCSNIIGAKENIQNIIKNKTNRRNRLNLEDSYNRDDKILKDKKIISVKWKK